MRSKISLRSFIVVAWFAMLFTLLVAHIMPVAKVVRENSYADIARKIKKRFPLRVRINDFFVEMNGGVVRLLAQNRCNDTYKLKTGHLVRLAYSTDMLKRARDVAALSCFCKERKIRFLFVLNPYRTGSLSSIDSVPGDSSDANADAFLRYLDQLEVPYLDLREEMRSRGSAVGDLYFKTDNHWNFDGVMTVFPVLASKLASMVADIDEETCDEKFFAPLMWERLKFPRNILGSYGRRTGRLFASMESCFYYVPKFGTDLTVTMAGNVVRHGRFQDSMLNREVFKPPVNAFGDDAYNCYFRFRSCENALAPIKKSLVIIDDSYGYPEAAYLATLFRKVEQIDLRWDDVCVTEVLKKNVPDVVVVLYNSSALSWSSGPNCIWPICR